MTSPGKQITGLYPTDIKRISGLPRLPDWVPPSADDLNDLSNASRSTQEIASPTIPLPVVYGRTLVPGKIAVVHVDDTNGFLYALFSLAEPCTGIDKVFVDGIDVEDATDGLIAKGGEVEMFAAGLVVSTLLSAVIPGYADAPASCNIVVKCPKNYQRTFPKIEAIVRGREVYDPRSTLTGYSDNPSLCFADMAAQAGWDVNWASVEEAADFDDELVGGVKRRTLGLLLAEPRPAEDWAKVFRVYTGCFINWENGLVKLTPDKAMTLPEDVTRTFSADDIVSDSILMRRRNPSSFPTTVIVEYTDNSDDDHWRTERAVYEQPGVTSHRVSRVSLPGIHSYAQAYREAKERQLKFLNDLTIEMTVFDEALDLLAGSIVRVVHPIGLDGHFRVTHMGADQGRWRLSLAQYTGTEYSNDAPTAPVRYVPSVGSPESLITFRDTVFGVVRDTLSGGVAKKFVGEDHPFNYVDGARWGQRSAMSKDGSTLVIVGYEDYPPEDTYAYIYTSADGFETQQAAIRIGALIADETAMSREVDISDDGSVIVAAVYDSPWVLGKSIRVFHGPNWTTETELPVPAAANSAEPSNGVAISGNGAVIVAHAQYGANRGELWVYSGTNWTTETVLLAGTPADANQFGWRHAINYDGSVIVAGDGNYSAVGGADVVVCHGAAWATRTTLATPPLTGPDGWGYPTNLAINASGDTVAVTGYDWDDFGTQYAVLHILNGTNWSNVYGESWDITPLTGEYTDQWTFGAANLDISDDGTRVAVSKSRADHAFPYHSSGDVWLYDYTGGTWSNTAIIDGNDLLADWTLGGVALGELAQYFGWTGINLSGDGTLLFLGGDSGDIFDEPDYIWRVPMILLDMDASTGSVISVVPTITILGVDGLTGGGDLTANREITLGFDGLPTADGLSPGSDIGAVYRPGDDAHFKTTLLDLPGTKTSITYQTDNYTLAATDLYVRMDSATAVDVEVPDNATVPIPVGYIKAVRQVGAGRVTLVPGTGVTLNSAASLSTRMQNSTVFLTKVATNEWDVAGDLD